MAVVFLLPAMKHLPITNLLHKPIRLGASITRKKNKKNNTFNAVGDFLGQMMLCSPISGTFQQKDPCIFGLQWDCFLGTCEQDCSLDV